jgi:hypothetical protein
VTPTIGDSGLRAGKRDFADDRVGLGIRPLRSLKVMWAVLGPLAELSR